MLPPSFSTASRPLHTGSRDHGPLSISARCRGDVCLQSAFSAHCDALTALYTREIAFLEACGLLRSGQRILDVACGGGRHSLAMARRGALVTGIDLGPAAIATARRRAHKAGLAVEFVQGDVRAIEYEAVFDAVTFIFGCFTEMPRHDAEEVLRRISRSLRPGGMFVLDVYAPRFFAALDGEQEWWVGHDFIAGRFPAVGPHGIFLLCPRKNLRPARFYL